MSPNDTSNTVDIPLTRGQFTIIDRIDHEITLYQKWCANFSKRYSKGGAFVAVSRTSRKLGKQRTMYMHRVIMERVLGRKLESSEIVDHVNGNTLDNRRCNLRIVNPSQNATNRDIPSNNKSGFLGVSWIASRQRWQAYISINGKQKNLGYYENFEDACIVRNDAVKKHYGEFVRRKPDGN